ncbi:GNAT family N-acetyltransferase [Limoniibacter endophyticus]|uniref:Acetyltransferase n=1 Tax=Limoniibacter endophyticus TaxID=1565040 RepID=A0A8J3DFX0_9HYPH|nr:GNAT family N-acetyltransferase [Limoniibacter endophyticus]GHC62608.1 acetyltransferase [Limoniibacter endophyticus]
MMFFARTVAKSDLAAVRSLLAETWHATYDMIYGPDAVARITDEWHSISVLSRYIEKPQSEFLLADDGKRIGGVVFAEAIDGGKTIILRQLYVLPELQGQGIGTGLLDEIEGCFPDAERIRLEVEEQNVRAISYCLAQGFARVKSEPGPMEGFTTVTLERPILWAD